MELQEHKDHKGNSTEPSPLLALFGLRNGDQDKKIGFQFATGIFDLRADVEVAGEASVVATVAEILEVRGDIDATIFGSIEFTAGSKGQLIPISVWSSKLMNIKNDQSEYYDPNFAVAQLTFDGDFSASVSVDEPIQLELAGVEGYFREPFVLDLLNLTALNATRPDIVFEFDFPDFGDLRNLSLKDVIRLLKQALGLLVGEGENDTVESCSGGLLGKEIGGTNVFTKKIPVVGVSACDTAGFLQVIVDTVDTLVNDCPDSVNESDSDAEESQSKCDGTFKALEIKLETLLQDGVGGTPDVVISTNSNDIRSNLELQITLEWTLEQVNQFEIDLDEM